jgi:hypothetical protein
MEKYQWKLSQGALGSGIDPCHSESWGTACHEDLIQGQQRQLCVP